MTSKRTKLIVKLAMANAKISDQETESDEDPFLDSGSEYTPESDVSSDFTDQERPENYCSGKRKRPPAKKEEGAKKITYENKDTVYKDQERDVLRPGMYFLVNIFQMIIYFLFLDQDSKQKQKESNDTKEYVNNPEETIQITENELENYESEEVEEPQIVGKIKKKKQKVLMVPT